MKELTFHNGQYRASIGAFKTDGGERRAKVFMLGKDARVARLKEITYRKMWDALVMAAKARGEKNSRRMDFTSVFQCEKDLRTDLDFVHEAVMTLNSFDALDPDGQQAVTERTVKELGDPLNMPRAAKQIGLTLYEGIKRYVAHLEQRVKSNDLSDSNFKGQRVSMNRLKDAHKDVPLELVRYDQLQKIKLHFQARPKTPAGTPMRWGTIKPTLGHVRSFFRWLSDAELWDECRKFERVLRAKKTAADADEELDARKFDTFNVDELAKLYAAASNHLRCMLLVSLNTASEAQAIATLKKSHFKVVNGQPRICRVRNKKSSNGEAVYCEWDLWSETHNACKARIGKYAPRNPEHTDLAFVTRNGNALVNPTKSNRVDSLNLAFSDLCATAEVRRRGFSMIRKTAGELVERLSDAATADAMLGHAPKSITFRHYVNRDFSKLHRTLRTLREQLQPLFDAAKDADVKHVDQQTASSY